MARRSPSAYGGRVCVMAVVMFAMMAIEVLSITVQSTSEVEAEHQYNSELRFGVRRFSDRRALRGRGVVASEVDQCDDDDDGEEEEENSGCGSRRVCCNGQCVDVSRSSRSCGACNNQCAYNTECCRGVCVDTHASDPFHCGACGNVCADGVPCLFGLCGYNSIHPSVI